MHVNIDRVFTTVSRNLGLHDYGTYTDSWIEWAYEAEKLIGSISTFVHKEAVYSADGAKASGTIEFTSNPVSGDSIELNGATLYFRNATDLGQAKSPNEIEIGLGVASTLSNTAAQYGLIQSLIGFENITSKTGVIANAAVFNYPEALNISNYNLIFNTNNEILTNTGFTGSSTGWTLGTNITYGTNNIDFSSVTTHQKLNQAIAGSDFVVGDSYELSFTVSGYSGSGIIGGNLVNDTGKGFTIPNVSANGTYTTQHVIGEWETADDSFYNRVWLQVVSATVFTGVIDDVSLKKISTAVLSITSKEIGNRGNDYTLQSDTSNAKISGGSLSGGKDLYRNQQLRLPDDNIKMLAVRDSNHNELRKTSSVHTGRLGEDALRYYTQGNRLNIASTGVTELTVVYLAYPTDLRGWPMIKEGHETAVAQYIMWQQNLVKYYNGQIAQYIVKDLEKRWYLLCGKTRGDDGMPTSEELKQIGNIWNTMVPIKNNRGLIDL